MRLRGCAIGVRYSRTGGTSTSSGFPVGDELRQVLQLVGQVLVGDHVAEGEADGGQLAGQVLGVGLSAGGDVAVPLDVGPVALVLPVLREQDQRGGVRGLGGEGQVEQDERVRVPVVDPRR